MTTTTIAILGLGEAGGAFAAALVAAGARVRGYDPRVGVPTGVLECTDEADAARGADLILSVNSAADAITAWRAAAQNIGPGAVFADLNTAQPALERTLAGLAAERGVIFADVSIMAPVPGSGLQTPMLASGGGADAVARLLGGYGAAVTVLDAPAGAAAERKLLRSVFYKGMSAAVVEALTAARALGVESWLHDNIADELAAAGPHTVERILTGSHRHASRRADEMDAVAKMLADIGVDHEVAAAAAAWLHRLGAGTRHRVA